LDTTDKLEIGRYDLASVESMSDFFSIGVMYAAFMSDGTTPCCRDQQKRWHSHVHKRREKEIVSHKTHNNARRQGAKTTPEQLIH